MDLRTRSDFTCKNGDPSLGIINRNEDSELAETLIQDSKMTPLDFMPWIFIESKKK